MGCKNVHEWCLVSRFGSSARLLLRIEKKICFKSYIRVIKAAIIIGRWVLVTIYVSFGTGGGIGIPDVVTLSNFFSIQQLGNFKQFF